MGKWRHFFVSFGIIASFGGFLFLVDGAWQSYGRYVQNNRWPAVEARVVKCSIDGGWRYSGSSHSHYVWGKESYVRCGFDYEVGGVTHESSANIGSLIFTSKDQKTFPAPKVTEASMQNWIARHPAGSVLTIHYDPSKPGNISLAGADSELQMTSPYDRLWFGILVTAGGLVLVITGKNVGRRSRSKTVS